MDKDQIQKVVVDVATQEPRRIIKSVSLFGSFLHGQTREDSDVDLLVELDDSADLFDIGQLHYELERRLNRPVDLVTKRSLSKYLRQQVLDEAQKIYG